MVVENRHCVYYNLKGAKIQDRIWDDYMDSLAKLIVRNHRKVISIFIVATVIAAVGILFTTVNYNLSDYLPEKALSTLGIKVMNEEFTQAIPNTSVMARDVSLSEALEIKNRISEVRGVSEVLWLDSVVDLMVPLEFQDTDTIESFYSNQNALYSVTISKGYEAEAVEAIWHIVGEEGAVAGEAPNLIDMQQSAITEVALAVAIVLPAIIVILLFSTTSWLEPVLFLAAIGVSVIINMGTNFIFKDVSFVTNSVSPILQLAVSMDYAIFLLHSFEGYRRQYDDVNKAMFYAIKSSMTVIAASALTTLFGFLALVFMKFKIGPNLGITLAKGIIFSFISVTMFLPALTLSLYHWIDKLAHKSFMPQFKNINKYLSKLFVPIAIVVVLAIVPSFLGQRHTAFIYGNASDDPDRRLGRSFLDIEEEFGRTNILAVLVPSGDMSKETELSKELKNDPYIKSVVSYAESVGSGIPSGFLDEDITEQFYSDNYARIIMYTNLPDEGEITFAAVNNLENVITKYYDEYYMVGQSATLRDMKEVVDVDNVRVNLIAIIAIFLVVALAFKSITLPFILILTIEVAIWINLSVPYFTGTSINFIGYLVLNTVQLGATIDYAILLTDTFMGNRRFLPLKEAIAASLGTAFRSILVSASILSIAGFTLFFTSSNTIVQDIGLLLGRGTIISMLMVIGFLPSMLILFDKPIGKTTIGSKFFKKEDISKGASQNE